MSWLLYTVLHWTLVCIYHFWITVFSRYVPRSEIAGSYGGSVFSVFFSKQCPNYLHHGCTNFHSHQQCRRVPFSSGAVLINCSQPSIMLLWKARWIWNSNTLAIWCKELTHWKRLWCWERLRGEEKGTTEDEMVGWHHQLNGHGFG